LARELNEKVITMPERQYLVLIEIEAGAQVYHGLLKSIMKSLT
jgi:putative ubiquitin-RnfH superfamily antitoxin RatB of RatAB toxin-antitoxin module